MTGTNTPGDIEYRKESELFKIYEQVEKSALFKSPMRLFQPEKKTTAELKEEARLKKKLRTFLNGGIKDQEMFKYMLEPVCFGYNVVIGRPKDISDYSDEDLLSEIRYRMNQREEY